MCVSHWFPELCRFLYRKIKSVSAPKVNGYRLFLDDERYPPADGNEWIFARTVDEAIAIVHEYGFPGYVSFDNDLGDGLKEGRDFAKFLVEFDMDTGTMPVGFQYYVHSQNPVATDAIRGLLDRYMEFRKE